MPVLFTLPGTTGNLITADGQLEYNGYLLGDDEITFLDAINGWDDLPSISSGNTPRPYSHGAWSGRKFAEQRIITWEGRFAPDPNNWASEIKKVRNAFSIPLTTEEKAIVIRSHTETLICYGSVTARAIPMDRAYGYYGARLSLQFSCPDPRRYSLGENSKFLGLPGSSTVGLAYPLTYPLYYGELETHSSGTLNNDGDVVTPVVIEFNGPVTNPVLINATTQTRLGFNITLADTETLIVDTRTGTVLLNGVADRLYTRTVSSAPILSFGLTPGDNDMQIMADSWSAPAGVNIKWRDATL